MKKTTENQSYGYDYQNKCDCSDDDNCGCDYPNNMERNFDSPYTEKIKASVNIISKQAPDFTAPALLSNNMLIERFNFYKYTQGHIAVLFFYPEDFTFTCPSELLMLNQELNAFNRRGAKILAISTDTIHSHLTWKELPPHKDGISDISFPLIADEDRKISAAYHILSPRGTAHRATFIIDENRLIRHLSLNDNKIWRNPTEIIRIIDILNHKGDGITNCPPGWKQNFSYERPEPQSLTEIYAKKNLDI